MNDPSPAIAVEAHPRLPRGVRLVHNEAQGGWVLLAGSVTVGQVGELLHLPSWVVGLSPYAHVPRVPVEALDPLPLLWLTSVAVLVAGAALLRFGSRDVG